MYQVEKVVRPERPPKSQKIYYVLILLIFKPTFSSLCWISDASAQYRLQIACTMVHPPIYPVRYGPISVAKSLRYQQEEVWVEN